MTDEIPGRAGARASPTDGFPGLAGAARLAAGLRRRATLAVLLGGLGALALVCLAMLALPVPSWREPGSPLPLVALGVALGTVAAAGFAAGSLRRRLALVRLAGEAEEAAGLGSGELVGALELAEPGAPVPPGGRGSPALVRLHRERVDRALAVRVSGPALLPRSWRTWRDRLRVSGIAALAVVGALAAASATSPRRAALAADALAHPWRIAFPPPPPPLTVEPRGAEVERGTPLRVRVRAPGRTRVRLAWRVEGEVAGGAALDLHPPADTASGLTGRIEAPTRYWAEDAGGFASDTFLVRPRDGLFLTELAVTVVYPAWLGREPESHARPLPALAVPVGSRLRLRGSANRLLERATLREAAGGRSVVLDAAEGGFEGELRPTEDGVWVWELAAAGEPAAVAGDTLRVAVVPDSLPSVAVVHPGADTILGASLALPLVLDARDDVGVASVEVVSWRVSGSGTRGPEESVRVAGPTAGGSERRLILRPLLEAGDRGLLPGDTLLYFARVRDENPRHPAVSSDTFRARVPGLGELRARAVAAADRLAEEARELGEGAARLEREAREAERGARPGTTPEGRPPAAPTERGAGERASFSATEEGRRVLSGAESLEERLADLGERLDALRQEMERSGLMDPGFREQLRQLEELYRELLESGLRERIEELRRALRDLDAEALRTALDRVSEEMRDIRERLEQSVALMEKVAAEQALEDLAARTDALAGEQREAAETARRDEAWARAEERLAAEAERLAAELESLRERLAAAAAGRASDSVGVAGGRARDAAEAMRDAAEAGGGRPPEDRATEGAGAEDRAEEEAADREGDARAGEAGSADPPRPGARAGESGRAAGAAPRAADDPARRGATEMESAAGSLRAARTELREDWREEALAAVERATGEALGLAREQGRLLGELGEGGGSTSTRARQAALRQGLENLSNALAEAGRKTALLDRRVGPAAASAARGMDRVLESLEPGAGAGRLTRSEGEALVESLNELAGRLLASRQAIESSRSATGMEEALEQLARMAQAQGGLSQETGGLLSLQERGEAIGAALRRVAEEQAAIARQLRQLDSGASGELLGRPEQMAAEAEEISDRLATGGLDPETVRRQERLFRRLLDAGRTLEKEEEDPRRRESRTAGVTGRPPPPPLDPSVLAGPRWPHPDPAAMRAIPAAYRALVLEYFDRLNRDGATGEEGVGGR